MTEKQAPKFHNPSSLAKPLGYTHVVETRGGRTIYLSGQVALDSEGNLVGEDDFRAQIEQVFENIKAALEAVGADFNSVVKLNFYMLDASKVSIAREVRDRYVNVENPPASTAVQVSQLVREDWLVEVDAVAVALE